MNNNDKYLALYKQYESLLRQHGKEYKDIEDTSPEKIQGRLRIGRQIRNYLTHNSDLKFLEVSDTMINFYQEMVDTENLENDLVKSHTKSKTVSMVTPKDKCGDALEKMRKLKISYIGVYEDDGILGFATIYDVVAAYMKTKTAKMSDVKISNKFSYAKATDPAIDYKDADTPVFVVDNKGKINGTFLR